MTKDEYMPMEGILQKVARILAKYDFTFADYRIDGGKSVVKHAIAYYMRNGEVPNDEAISAIRRYVFCRYEQMKNDAVQWCREIPVMYTGDEISFSFRGISVSGIVSISPKNIGVTMMEPCAGLHVEARIQASAPIIFTRDMADGSPTDSGGAARARELLKQMFFDHFKFTC